MQNRPRWKAPAINRTPAQQADMDAVRLNNHGEVSFRRIWAYLAANVPFPFQEQVPVDCGRNWYWDFFNKEVLLAIEIDGGIHQEVEHEGNRWANKRQAEADREKRNKAVEKGIACLVYSVQDLETYPEKVIKQVLTVLDMRRRKDV